MISISKVHTKVQKTMLINSSSHFKYLLSFWKRGRVDLASYLVGWLDNCFFSSKRACPARALLPLRASESTRDVTSQHGRRTGRTSLSPLARLCRPRSQCETSAYDVFCIFAVFVNRP